MARHPTSRRLLTARRGHDLALGLDGPEPASAHPPVARRAVSPFDRSRAIRARRNYAGTSPITKASGTGRVVLARFARNERLFDACYLWAFSTSRSHPALVATTTGNVLGARLTARRYERSGIAWSGSFMAV
jgi:hypothetical protein